MAIPLVHDSLVESLDRLVAKAGIAREVRFLSPDGKHTSSLESRTIRTPSGWLAYVNNLDHQHPLPIKLASTLPFNGIRNLTLERDLPLSFMLPAGETWILKLKQ